MEVAQSALVAAKLRSIDHYCPNLNERIPVGYAGEIKVISNRLASYIEKVDAAITPAEFRDKLELARGELDSSYKKSYHNIRAENGESKLVLGAPTKEAKHNWAIQTLFLLTIYESVLPPKFSEELKAEYGLETTS